ncbi:MULTISPECIES: hypothetical protein [unclassified Solwaraspora]|uniref:hypothetical protein n=1 Tax=unclassified Solwaraspora TaxID=2627926 RepID=UPI00259B2F6C|nr:hypothetical protein [Solwaraspora sp. WMMA2056]WJK43489.1 hypothetical protein O7608_14425 [Solwaraspora sp. WMMA2056]
MRQRATGRLVAATALLLAFGAATLTAGRAQAAPPAPTSVTVEGDDMPEPLTVTAEADSELFTAMLGQVNWLTGPGQTSSPEPAALGPKYQIVVLIDDDPSRSYELYPLAEGGPRAFRPAEQPDGSKTTAAWFFGRLTMSETLRAAGAPLPARPDSISGGIGGGERVIPQDALNPGEDLDKMFAELRHVLLLNGAVVVSITLGLAAIALLVRRRTR